MSADMILIVDFGASKARDVARKLRGDNIFCEIIKPETASGVISEKEPRGLILAGDEIENAALGFDISAINIPVLAMGACSVLLCRELGGSISGVEEIGRTESVGFAQCALFEGLMESDRYLESVFSMEMPAGFSPIALTSVIAPPAFGSDEDRKSVV